METQNATLSNNQTEDISTAALKKALQIELHNKKQCGYRPYECSQLCLDGYKYCARHILNEKSAPFKQCNFMYSNNGKKCYLPALKGDKKDIGYCSEHALKSALSRNKQNCKYQPPKTVEVLLNSLSHYIKRPRTRTHSQQSDECATGSSVEDNEVKVTKSLDPFTDIDAFNLHNNQCNEVLGFCSESESDVETSTLNNIWQDAHGDSSDNESIDSEQEDYLKHANVYTAEEITSIARDKLIRLQSLYIEEYRHLQYLLKEKRRKYLHSLKREKDTCCNIYNQVHDNPKEQRLYKKLKAYNSYHKLHGEEAILAKRVQDLRTKTADGVIQKPNNFTKCLFTEGGVKCGEKTLPLARHCRKHILEDPNQVLFRSCGKVRADVECNTPVEDIFDDTNCKLHADIPTIKSYNLSRKDSESDYDESVENTLPPDILEQSQLHLSSMINDMKSELSPCSEVPKMKCLPSMLFEDSANDTNDEIDNTDILNENFEFKEELDSEIKDEGISQNSSVSQEPLEIIEKNVLNEDSLIEQDQLTETNNIKIEDENVEINTQNEVSNESLNKMTEIPMEFDEALDESTDTASETTNEIKRELIKIEKDSS